MTIRLLLDYFKIYSFKCLDKTHQYLFTRTNYLKLTNKIVMVMVTSRQIPDFSLFSDYSKTTPYSKIILRLLSDYSLFLGTNPFSN